MQIKAVTFSGDSFFVGLYNFKAKRLSNKFLKDNLFALLLSIEIYSITPHHPPLRTILIVIELFESTSDVRFL